jgi:hypothetical protein
MFANTHMPMRPAGEHLAAGKLAGGGAGAGGATTTKEARRPAFVGGAYLPAQALAGMNAMYVFVRMDRQR